MRYAPFLLIFAVGSFTFAVDGQTTVTNADLEKYKQRRLAAEQDLRENYAKMGFLSPEKQAREDARSQREREEFASRLRAERLQREQAEAARRQAEVMAAPDVIIIDNGRALGYGFSSHWRGRDFSLRSRFPRPVSNWRATPGGVIYEPGGRSSFIYSPSQQRPRPAFRRP